MQGTFLELYVVERGILVFGAGGMGYVRVFVVLVLGDWNGKGDGVGGGVGKGKGWGLGMRCLGVWW